MRIVCLIYDLLWIDILRLLSAHICFISRIPQILNFSIIVPANLFFQAHENEINEQLTQNWTLMKHRTLHLNKMLVFLCISLTTLIVEKKMCQLTDAYCNDQKKKKIVEILGFKKHWKHSFFVRIWLEFGKTIKRSECNGRKVC